MSEQEVMPLIESSPALSDIAFEAFIQGLHGAVLQPAEPGYDEARAVWNAMIDRRPALIARCTTAEDVIASVRFARKHDLLLAVRGGGHNVTGNAVCDGGLMIDLSLMNNVHVDPEKKTARVGGGATWADVDRAAQAFGLATPGGVVSTTGVAGLTLGGGFGWLARKFGLATDNVLAVDVVTADGELVTASATENPELFWGIRGSGGNFGIVTSFEFRLHQVGPEVLFGPTVYRHEDAAHVLRHYREFARSAPRECCVWADSLTAPPLPFLPEAFHGTKILTLMQCYVGDIEEGMEVLRPLREYGEPIGDVVGPTPYTAAQSILDEAYDKGARNYWTSHNFATLSDDVIDLNLAHADTLPTPQSDILIAQVGGAINDVAPDATAYPHRGVEFIITPGARWLDPAQDEACINWIRGWSNALAPHATGGMYVNFIAEREGRERNAYGSNYDRLVALKNKYDPTNLFRMNQNVRPAT